MDKNEIILTPEGRKQLADELGGTDASEKADAGESCAHVISLQRFRARLAVFDALRHRDCTLQG